jgi:hypothetical protein
MNKKPLLILLGAVVVFLPLSNLLGLSGKNEPISVVSGSTPNFSKVSEVFQNKCVDCHSPGMTRMPIYANLPIAKQLMEKDIRNATARLILNKSLYSGEEKFTALDLARLEGVLLNNSMPPHLYLSMHWTAKLTADEKQTILAWISEERSKLIWSIDSSKDLKGEQDKILNFYAKESKATAYELAPYLEKETDLILTEWTVYRGDEWGTQEGSLNGLLIAPTEDKDISGYRWSIPVSMRSVDASVELEISRRYRLAQLDEVIG